jgi:Flp pilus assembly protein TadG
MIRPRIRRDEAGQAVFIELLVVLLPLLLIFAAAIEFGFAVSIKQSVQTAAQVGAEAAAQSGYSNSGYATALASLQDSGLAGHGNQITITSTINGSSCATATGGTYTGLNAVVTVTVNYKPVFPGLDSPMFGYVGNAIGHSATSSASLPVSTEYGAC